MSQSVSDRNVLFGLLALQNGFITCEQFISAFSVWILDKQRALEDIFIEQRALSAERLGQLQQIVAVQADIRGPYSVQTFASISSINQLLASLKDNELKAVLQTATQDYFGPAEQLTANGQSLPADSLDIQLKSISAGSGLRYHSLRPHAKGGLGEVSVAMDLELHREVALKEIQAVFADIPESRERFVLEAEITGGLEHPGIVPVYGLGKYSDGRPFYAMRFIRGDSLKEAIAEFHRRDNPDRKDPSKIQLALRQLLRRFIDVCNAMEYAHCRGVLHRDLKPGNIMLGKFGETLVVDWGLAKLIGRKEIQSEEGLLFPLTSLRSSRVTQAGSAFGTPAYMSPEQATGKLEELGPATDIYSLGATLYHLLTGKPPFDGTLEQVLIQVRLGQVQSLRKQHSAVPHALEAICLKAMALRPEDRYLSAKTLMDDLEHWLADESIAAAPDTLSGRLYRWGRKNRAIVQIGSLSLIVVATVATFAAFSINNQKSIITRQALAATILANEKSILADEKSTLAETSLRLAESESRQKVIAEQERSAAERQFASATLTLAQNAWETHDYSRYRQLLERLAPGQVIARDRRGFEWHLLRRMAEHQQASLIGHQGAILKLVPRANGDLLSVGQDGVIRHWPQDSSEGSQVVWNAGVPFSHCAATRDGQVLAVASQETKVIDGKSIICGRVRVLSAAELKVFFEAEISDSDISSIALSENAERLAIKPAVSFAKLSKPGEIRLWNLTARMTEPTIITTPLNSGAQLTFSSNGDLLIVAGNEILVENGKTKALPKLEAYQVNSKQMEWSVGTGALTTGISTSAEETTIATMTLSGSIQFYEVNSGKLRREFTGHQGAVSALAFSADGGQMASVGVDQSVRVWELASGRQTAVFLGHRGELATVAFDRQDGPATVVSAGSERVIKRWSLAEGGRSYRKLSGQIGAINALAVAPNGPVVAGGGQDGQIRLWDLARTGNDPFQSFGDHQQPVTAIAFSPDGQLIASADGALNRASTVVVREIDTGRLRFVLEGFRTTVRALTFSPDGSVLLTGDGNAPSFGEVIYWETATGRRLRIVPGEINEIHGLTFSPDGTTLAISGGWADQLGRLRLWNAETGKVRHDIKGFGQKVTRVAFSPDGTQLAAGSGFYFAGGEIKVLQTSDGAQRLSIPGHLGPVMAVAISPDGERLVSAGRDQFVKIWDMVGGELLLTLRGHQHPVTTAMFSQDGTKLITVGGPVVGDAPSEIFVWDAALTADRIVLRAEHGAQLKDVGFISGDRPLWIGLQSNNFVTIWDGVNGSSIRKWSIPGDFTQSLAVAADGSQMVTTGTELMHWWDPRSGELIHSSKLGDSEIGWKVAYSAAGDAVALAVGIPFGTQQVRVYDSQTKKLGIKSTTEFVAISSLKWSPDGRILAVVGVSDLADSKGKIQLLNIQDGKLFREVNIHQQAIADVAFSPDSQLMAVAESISTLSKSQAGPVTYIVKVATGEVLTQCDGHSLGHARVDFSIDGRTLVTVGRSDGVKFWNVITGELQRAVNLDVSPEYGAWLTKDGQSLAIATTASLLELWDLKTGVPREQALNWPRPWKSLAQALSTHTLPLAERVGRLPSPQTSNSITEARRFAALADRRTLMSNRLKEVAIAFHNYHSAFKKLPSAAITSKEGRPLLSWRVALLPFLRSGELYGKFHLDEPWDSPHNKPLLANIPDVFALPLVDAVESGPHRRGIDDDIIMGSKPSGGLTHIRIVTGASTLFPDPATNLTFADITDGAANTILFLEHADSVPWTKPEELFLGNSTPDVIPRLSGSIDPTGFYVAYANGSVQFLDLSAQTTQQLRAKLTRNGGEPNR